MYYSNPEWLNILLWVIIVAILIPASLFVLWRLLWPRKPRITPRPAPLTVKVRRGPKPSQAVFHDQEKEGW